MELQARILMLVISLAMHLPNEARACPTKEDHTNLTMICLPESEASTYIRKGPIFRVKQGCIRGTVITTNKGKTFTAFFAIPYAEPPLGNLRFKAPLPGRKWNGVLQATTEGPRCLQRVLRPALLPNTTTLGEEDCVKLNVYVPTTYDGHLISKKLPVYVWLYGGGYVTGEISYESYGPQRIINTADIIVVTVNYRLAAFGYLSTGDSAASGNWGLLDQNLALKWVRDNIASFGGNPKDVTLGGESAGAASAMYHMLSPKSAGLFHRVIAQSSSALCPYALRPNPLFYARKLAQVFSCDVSNNAKMVDCLRKQDAKEIAKLALSAMDPPTSLNIPFAPVVENRFTGRFLTEDPLKLLQEGRYTDVPIIIGTNRDEGTVGYILYGQYLQGIDPSFFNVTIPFIVSTTTHYNTNLQEISAAIEQQYYNINRSDPLSVARANLDLLGDAIITSWTIKSVDIMASHGTKVYLYAFNYVGDAFMSKLTGASDVSHFIEVLYEFNTTAVEPLGSLPALSSRDEQLSEKFLKLWCNFITKGNPTPSGSLRWTPTPPNVHKHLVIDSEFSIANGYLESRLQFWNETIPAIVAG